MRRFLISSFLVWALLPLAGQAQRDSSRNDFTNAESWFLFEDYGEAEAIYQKLLRYDPENDNLKYRIGVCLLNDPYRKDESIRYLLEASDNINPGYKEGSFKENTAPPDVLYYLGNAYLVNNRIDEALDAYRRFQRIMDPDIYDVELVKAQIQACENAKRLMSMPVDIDLYPATEGVNTRYPETNPVISGDGNRMAFVTDQPFFDEALFIEKNADGTWTLPMSLTSMLGFDADIYPVALNYDGTEMLLYYDDEHIGNLYMSRYEDGFWGKAEKLGENITTKYWESHACFTKDGRTLYFTSNRKGGFGGLDIYRSERQADGRWGPPVNLGPTVNTRYNEETPFITMDGKTLYFSSYGHFNMGGYDIFYSTLDDKGSWTEPVNLGYPINTTDDDLFFQPVKNGFAGYQSRFEQGSQGRHDIYYMDIYSANNPRVYLVTGFVRTEDGDTDLTTLQMFVIDPESGDTVKYSIPIAKTGEFRMDLTQGDYELHFSGEGYEDLIRPLSITASSNKEGIELDEVLELSLTYREPLVFEGEESMIQLKDSLYEGVTGKALIVPVKMEKEATLVQRVYQDSTLVSVDTLEFDRRRNELEITPLPGTSLVELETVDEEGNIHRNSFILIGKEPAPTRKERREAEAREAEVREAEATGADAAGTAQAAGEAAGTAQAAGAAAGLVLFDLQEEAKEGSLKDYLDQLDLEQEGIRTTDQLIDHLYEEADKGSFSQEDMDSLLAAAIAGDDAERLYGELLEHSEGPLKQYLEELDLEAEGIDSPEALLEHLRRAAETEDFSMDDVRQAMKRSLEPDPARLMLSGLRKNAEDPLKDYLDQLDLEKEGIATPGQLFDHLYGQAGKEAFSKEELDLLMARTLSGTDVNELYRQLTEYAEGPLKDYLEGLDLEAEGIDSPEALLEHLRRAAETEDFSMDDVRAAMKKAMEFKGASAAIYDDAAGVARLVLLRNSEGPLRALLEELDPGRDGIGSRGELFRYLYDHAEESGYSKEEVDSLLTDMLARGNVRLLYRQLLENADGALKEFLEELDLEAEGIDSVEALLEYLKQATATEDFTMDDVRAAMTRALDHPLEVERICRALLESSEGTIREILEGIHLYRDGIFTVEDLIKAMYQGLEDRAYSEKEIRKLLSELFPGQKAFIRQLLKGGKTGMSTGVKVMFGLAGLGILVLILFWFRRKKEEE
jgi:hypothetical protein